MTKKVKQQAETWPRIYVGPSFPKSLLKQMTIFANGYPAPVADLIGQHPELKDLFVATAALPATMVQIAKKGSYLHSVYQRATTFKGE